MTASDRPQALSVLDRPNSYIGKTVPRPNLDRLMQGRGQYVSDIELPRMAHVVFLRSPYAHARIVKIDTAAAKIMSGVIAIVTGQELAAVITPWVGVLSHMKGLKSAPQHAIAIDRACWQGEAVAAVVATSRALAEDAAERIVVEYEELEVVTDMRTNGSVDARMVEINKLTCAAPAPMAPGPMRRNKCRIASDRCGLIKGMETRAR